VLGEKDWSVDEGFGKREAWKNGTRCLENGLSAEGKDSIQLRKESADAQGLFRISAL